jgi:hypothetical protein
MLRRLRRSAPSDSPEHGGACGASGSWTPARTPRPSFSVAPAGFRTDPDRPRRGHTAAARQARPYRRGHAAAAMQARPPARPPAQPCRRSHAAAAMRARPPPRPCRLSTINERRTRSGAGGVARAQSEARGRPRGSGGPAGWRRARVRRTEVVVGARGFQKLRGAEGALGGEDGLWNTAPGPCRGTHHPGRGRAPQPDRPAARRSHQTFTHR